MRPTALAPVDGGCCAPTWPGAAPVLRDVSLEIDRRRGHRPARARTAPASRRSCWRWPACCGPPRARCSLGDQDLTSRRPEQIRRAGVAVVPEGRRLLPELTVADNLRVATYALGPDEAEQRHRVRPRAVPRAEAAVGDDGPLAVGRRAADGGAGPGPGVAARRCSSWTSCRSASPRSWSSVSCRSLGAVAATGVGVLLIEQFAHVALGLANRAYILEGGRIRYEGTAQELKDNPELLHSAYLLRV